MEDKFNDVSQKVKETGNEEHSVGIVLLSVVETMVVEINGGDGCITK